MQHRFFRDKFFETMDKLESEQTREKYFSRLIFIKLATYKKISQQLDFYKVC